MERPAPKLTLPPRLLALDFIGALLLGLGLAERFADTGLVPAAWRFPDYPLAMMVAGMLLMLPLLRHIVGFAREQARRRARETRG